MGAKGSRCASGGGGGGSCGSGGGGGGGLFDDAASCGASGGSGAGCSGVPGCSSKNPKGNPNDLCNGIARGAACTAADQEKFALPYLTQDPVQLKAFGWKPIPYGPPVYVCVAGFGVGQAVYQRFDPLNKCMTHYGVRKLNPFKSVQKMSSDPIYCIGCKDMRMLEKAVFQFRDDLNPPQVFIINSKGEIERMLLTDFLRSTDPDLQCAAKYMLEDYPKQAQKYYTVRPGDDFKSQDFGPKRGAPSSTAGGFSSPSGVSGFSQPRQTDRFGNPVPQKTDRFGNPVPQKTDRFGDPVLQQTDRFGNPVPQQTDRFGNPVPQQTDRFGNPVPQQTDRFGNPISQKTDRFGNPVPQQTDSFGNPITQTRASSTTQRRPVQASQFSTVRTSTPGGSPLTQTTRTTVSTQTPLTQTTRTTLGQRQPSALVQQAPRAVSSVPVSSEYTEEVAGDSDDGNMTFGTTSVYKNFVDVELNIPDSERCCKEVAEQETNEVIRSALSEVEGWKSAHHSTATVAHTINQHIACCQ